MKCLTPTAALVTLSLLFLAAPGRADDAPWTAIHVEEDLSCGIKGEELYCWGSNGSFKPGPLPARQALPGKVKKVTWGPCALLQDGRAFCRERAGFSEVPGRFRDIAGRRGTMCALRDDGQLVCGAELKDAKLVVQAPDWVKLARWPLGSARACGVLQGGQVQCVGPSLNATPLRTTGPGGMSCAKEGADGRCEIHAMTFGGARPFVDVVRKGLLICGLDAEHELWCLEDGVGAFGAPKAPALTGVRMLHETVAGQALIDVEGRLTFSGRGDDGLCADGGFDSCREPPAVFAGSFVDVAIDRHACAIRDDGKAFCWGPGFKGQLGDGQQGPFEIVTRPVEVGVERPAGSWATPVPATDDWLEGWPVNDHRGMNAYRHWVLTRLREGIRACDVTTSYGSLEGTLKRPADGHATWKLSAREMSARDALCLSDVIKGASWPASAQGRLKLSRSREGWSAVEVEVFRRRTPDRVTRPFDMPEVTLGPPDACAGVWMTVSVRSGRPPLSLPTGSPVIERKSGWRACAERTAEGRLVETIYGVTGGLAHVRFQRIDGQVDGMVVAATPEGELQVRERYRDGQRHGPAERWDPYGGRVLDCTYRDGRPSGRCRRWAPLPKVGESQVGSSARAAGKLQEDLSFDDAGRPSGMHKRWGSTGALVELATYPSDLRGAFGFRFSDQWAVPTPKGYLRGLSEHGGYVWFTLGRRGEIVERVVYDARGRPMRTLLDCKTRTRVKTARLELAESIVLSPGESVDDDDIVADANKDWLRGLYAVSARVDEDGLRFVTFEGREGSSFEGARYETIRIPLRSKFKPEGQGWEKRYGEWRREVKACRPAAELDDVPELKPLGPSPRQVRYWPARSAFDPPQQPGQPAAAGAQLKVTRYNRTVFEGCEPVATEEVAAEQVPEDIRRRVAWVDLFSRDRVIPAGEQATSDGIGKAAATPVLDPPVPAPAACGEMVDIERN